MKTSVYRSSLILLPLLALAPWLVAHPDMALNLNHIWLSLAAERLLAGESMVTGFYEPNPPLILPLYILPVLFGRLFELPLYYALFAVNLLYFGLSTLASWLLLKRFPELSFEQKAVILTAYLSACTFITGHWFFGDRDELTLWGLFPFLLLQIAITRNIQIPVKLSLPVLIFGALAIVIKPHYGLLPTLVLLYRMYIQKRFISIVKDADFIALAGVVTAYSMLMAVFFRDYFIEILPDMLALYLRLDNAVTVPLAIKLYNLVLVLLAGAAFFSLNLNYKKPLKLCLLAATISLVLFMIQVKGFYYHLIPALTFIYCGFALLLQGVLIHKLGSRKTAAFLSTVMIIVLAATMFSHDRNKLRHKDFKEMELVKLAEQCAPSCGIFVFSANMETIQQIPFYAGATFASRYPVLWWLPPLMPGSDYYKKNSQKAEQRLQTHIDRMAEDLNRYKPEYLAILTNRPLFSTGSEKNFDFITFFSRASSFRKAIEPYRKIDKIEEPSNDYFYGVITDPDEPFIYDIYQRAQ